MAYKIRKTKHFIRQRLESPKKFDPRSFRTVVPREDIRVIVGCPKKEYCPSCPHKKKCKVGLKTQAILYRK
jgi:hypothetical protein